MKKLFYIRQQVSLFASACFSYLFSREECVVCGRTGFHNGICPLCKKDLISSIDFNPEKRCGVCGKQLLSEKELCMECRDSPVIEASLTVFPLFSYRLWAKNALFLWKMQGKRNISSFFAMCMNIALKKIYHESSFVIVPVPPRKGKIRKKGWDQIKDLCAVLSGVYGYKIWNILERKSSGQQKKLDRSKRLENAGSSYGISYKILGKTKKIPENAVIIDDVLTTGATVNSCGKALLGAGVKNVKSMTIFIVD